MVVADCISSMFRSVEDGQGGEPINNVTLVIDHSSSMRDITTAAYGGARELITSYPPDTQVRVNTFSTTVQLGDRAPRDHALAMLSTPVANGTTALYNALVQSIEAEESAAPDAADLSKNTLVVVTDGIDTASTRPVADARACVERAQANGMRILFLGANQDAVLSASAFGIARGQALTFGASEEGVRVAMRSTSHVVARMRSGGGAEFTDAERHASDAAPPSHVQCVDQQHRTEQLPLLRRMRSMPMSQ